MKAYKPDYNDGSIVNLMSSIMKASGAKPLYKELDILKADDLKSKNILLIVIDGLGYEYLKKFHNKGFLFKNIRGRITSVYPPTTSAAVTTFLTGLAPQEHAITGWFVYIKEIGAVTTILRCKPRIGGKSFANLGIDTDKIFDSPGIGEKIKRKYLIVTHEDILNSEYNKSYTKKSKIITYNDMTGFFKGIIKAVKTEGKKYIYAYWGELDHTMHEFGTNDPRTIEHFRKIEKGLERLHDDIKGTDTAMIITADHGLINTRKQSFINLEEHPQLASTLALPLSGDGRAAYCYVRPSKTKEFEHYVRKRLCGKVMLYKSTTLVQKNFFGLHKPHPKLLDRIGDYVLISKKDHVMIDKLEGEIRKKHCANHGGTSKEEMFVPLIVIKR